MPRVEACAKFQEIPWKLRRAGIVHIPLKKNKKQPHVPREFRPFIRCQSSTPSYRSWREPIEVRPTLFVHWVTPPQLDQVVKHPSVKESVNLAVSLLCFYVSLHNELPFRDK